MAAVSLLAVGTAAADSPDIVVAAGTPVTVFIKAAASGVPDSGAVYAVKLKTLAGTYHQIGQLDCATPYRSLTSPGTYQVSRIATGASSGLEQG